MPKDGWLEKRTNVGQWKLRYVRIESFWLLVFSDGISEIRRLGPGEEYEYSAKGVTHTEKFDLRTVAVRRLDRRLRALTDDEFEREGMASAQPPAHHRLFCIRQCAQQCSFIVYWARGEANQEGRVCQ